MQQQTNGSASCALGSPAFPSSASNVQVCPRVFFRKTMQKFGGNDGPAITPPDIGHICKIALQCVGIGIIERHSPAKVHGFIARFEEFLSQLVFGCKHAASNGSQGNDTSACQRRDVNHSVRFETLGIG